MIDHAYIKIGNTFPKLNTQLDMSSTSIIQIYAKKRGLLSFIACDIKSSINAANIILPNYETEMDTLYPLFKSV